MPKNYFTESIISPLTEMPYRTCVCVNRSVLMHTSFASLETFPVCGDSARVGVNFAHKDPEGAFGYMVAIEHDVDQVGAVLMGDETDCILTCHK